jgi:hypothetical protein
MNNENKLQRSGVMGRVWSDVVNISDAVEEELGYVKSVLCAIELMAETDSHRYVLEIVSLAKCGHWMADNLEGNVDQFGGEILSAIRENENV